MPDVLPGVPIAIDRYRSDPESYCSEPTCPLSKRAFRTRTRVRIHVKQTGHTMRVVVTDLTVYTRPKDPT